MNKNELLDKIAPCSLMCHTCGAYNKGIISDLSSQLLSYMNGVYEFYKKHSLADLERFKAFKEQLTFYASADCSGCRSKEHNLCCIKGCFILECVKNHEIDFCGECIEFPCDKTQNILEKEVYVQWLSNNEKIKLYGIQAFWEEHKETPHYLSYKNNI